MGPIEIADMSKALHSLAKCEALKPEVGESCLQAAVLLEEMRGIILGSTSEDPAIEQLKFLLTQQGEG